MNPVERLFSMNSTLNDYKDINFSKPNFPSKKLKPPSTATTISIKNFIPIKAKQLMDFVLIDLDIIYLIAIPVSNYVLIFSFTKSPPKLTQEHKKIFKSNNPDDPDEDLYAIAFAILKSDQLILACGGLLGFVYILYIEESLKIKELSANNGDVYALSFPPKTQLETHSWLLAGYKNGYTILWGIETSEKIAQFRDFNQNPPSDVSSLDWHISGNFFVAGHLDTKVLIWEIGEEIKTFQKDSNNKFINKVIPMKGAFDAHSNYVDCVKFWEELLISKDVEGNLLIWTPFKETIFLINAYHYDYYEAIWWIKFTINQKMEVICLGNDNGEIFVYKMKAGVFTGEKYEEENIESKRKYFDFCKEEYDLIFILEDERKVIRKALITDDEKFIFCISDGGKLWWKSIKD